ncbi:MAG TPA: ATP-binding protein [Methylomirabilota bacterium]|nr:ATP-binding protein [Methylomirabilota bacterium]
MRGQARTRILLVEDDRSQARLLEKELNQEKPAKFELIHADCLRTGLQLLAEGGIDVVLLDLSLPDSLGHETFSAVRPHAPSVPIVILTGLDDERLALKAVHEGAQDYLIKGHVNRHLLVRATRYAIERKRVEEALRKSEEVRRQREKLQATATLLAGVAHELNNPLAIVVAETYLLRDPAGQADVSRRAEAIADAAWRCAQVVRTFIALADEQPTGRQPVALNQVVQEGVTYMANQLRSDEIEVQLHLAADLPFLLGDPYLLQQAIVKLMTNAEEAMRESPPPRTLTVTSRFAAGEQMVVLDIADTGPGVAPEIRSRIFDPLFTTKSPERTGLGLSFCQRIIQSHSGTIRLLDRPTPGAVFRIELPLEPPSLAREVRLPGSAGAALPEPTLPAQTR